MNEKHGFWGRAWHLFLVVVMSVAYFVSAIGVGVWELIKQPFNKER